MTAPRCACALVLLAACSAGGSETGNPVAARMGLGVRSADPEVIQIGSGAGSTVLEEAWLAFGQVTLLTETECANLGDIDIEGPTLVVADLARDDVRFTIEVPAQTYCGVAVPLNMRNDGLPDGAPEPLATHSIVLRGRRADGTPFELLHSEQETLELGAEAAGFEVAEAGPGLLLYFDVADWMDGIDLDSASVGDDGAIHIDASENAALLEAYEVNLECSLELFADLDGDGQPGAGDPSLASCIEE